MFVDHAASHTAYRTCLQRRAPRLQTCFDAVSASEDAAKHLANRLVWLFRESRTEGWTWFEGYLAYANARLPQALLLAGESLGNAEYTDIGLESA